MAELDIGQTATTDIRNSQESYTVDAEQLDTYDANGEVYWDFVHAAEHLGYYKQIPELKKAIDMKCTWTVGLGLEIEQIRDKISLENITGYGEDTIQNILWNMQVMKHVCGDSFAEIVRNEKGSLINLKPISPERIRIVVGKNGIIKRYEQMRGQKVDKKFKPEEILHLAHDRIGDEIHGTSVIDVCKWVIEARHEALTDYRVVLHRNRIPVRIIEIDTDDTAKRNALIAEYETAIKNGEVLVIPKGTVEMNDNTINITDPTNWIRYLEGFFYQAVGIPRVIATSQEYTEAASKVGYMTFEPIYTSEQTQLEADIWNQLAMRVKFNRPPSLHGVVSQDEQKNTGQTGIQQNEVTAGAGRVE